MNTYKMMWQGGSEQIREATDMRTLLAAIHAERRPEPVRIKRMKEQRR